MHFASLMLSDRRQYFKILNLLALLLINYRSYPKRQCSFFHFCGFFPWFVVFFPIFLLLCSLKLMIFMSDHDSDLFVFSRCSNCSLTNCWSLLFAVKDCPFISKGVPSRVQSVCTKYQLLQRFSHGLL